MSHDKVSKDKVRHTDPATDILQFERQRLDALFAPKSVAVIGATEKPGSVGRTILRNLINSPFGGTVYPVNPRHSSILGIKAYPNIANVGEAIDLAVIVTPAESVPGVMSECANQGVHGAIIISAGFKEIGKRGMELEHEVLAQAHRGHIRVIGPNCLGVMRPVSGLNATFASAMAGAGNVGFVSQSGALCTAVLDWSFRENVGFSAFVSIGSMLDVDWGDLIDYLGDDPRTQSIVIYMESIGDARSFISAAREVALTKPIIIIKAGRSAAAARAAASHTGALTGSDEVFDAVFSRCGVLRVNGISDLFHMSEVLAKQPRPRGPRLLIVTNAGGPGVLATDALIASDGKLADLSAETLEAFDKILPPHWSHNNPVDILGDANPQRYAQAVEIAAKDPNADGLLVILSPQAMTDPTGTAQELTKFAHIHGKPMLASWMGGNDVEPGETVLHHADIPTFGYPDTAAQMFTYMWRYTEGLRRLYDTPMLPEDAADGAQRARTAAQELIAAARADGRTLLSEFESKRLLAAYGIPTVETRKATSADEAVQHANEIGFPVVLKLHSHTLTHKSDVGGVQLNLQTAEAVRNAYQAIERGAASAIEPPPPGASSSPFGVGSETAGLSPAGRILTGRDEVPASPPAAALGHKGIDLRTPSMLGSAAGGHAVGDRVPQVLKHFLGVTVQPMVKFAGYELIVGSSIDSQFGPVLLFGWGGTLVEVFKDRALGLPPLNTTLARRMMEQTKIYHALRGVRGQKPVDLEALEQLLVRFSRLVVEQPWIKEIDINPLLASSEALLALDARVVLHDPAITEDKLPRLPIRPYPSQYTWPHTLKDGATAIIRPIRPEDEPLMVKFHQTLSETSVYMRYFHVLQLSQRIAHERLTRICFIDYDREMALVVDRADPHSGGHEILGVGRLSRVHGTNDAEFAILISDPWQGHGLGTELLRRLVEIGSAERMSSIIADILADNVAMQNVSRKLGFKLKRTMGDSSLRATLELG